MAKMTPARSKGSTATVTEVDNKRPRTTTVSTVRPGTDEPKAGTTTETSVATVPLAGAQKMRAPSHPLGTADNKPNNTKPVSGGDAGTSTPTPETPPAPNADGGGNVSLPRTGALDDAAANIGRNGDENS